MIRFFRTLKGILFHGAIQLFFLTIVIAVIAISFGESVLYTLSEADAPTSTNTSTPIENTAEMVTATGIAVNSPSPTIPGTATITHTLQPSSTTTPTMTSTQEESSGTKTITSTSIESDICTPPEDWILYTVESGDNLYRISLKFRTTVATLKEVNCMGSSSIIVTGQQLWVPNVATSTPLPSPTSTQQSVSKKTNTPQPTNTTTNTPTLTTTPTPEPTLTETTP